ncbi:MAG: xanthine dehydrogenase family protein subunit M [Candidatus Tectomicrobia bacterium]|uniref:Xanthine dehydrogenase family protein subunit M n=1 Tax=Tectimicrobiota bacterium TaxID=2528274 RepID=A0A937W235_UNCTE|nr:xanthine dehydrogenase family protein subunit M [Candidatus Tectomicrobia bacterium]
MKNFDYFDPTTVGEAVTLLRQHAGNVKVLAGGTDLFLRMHRRAVLPDVVVDLKRIPELAQLRYSPAEGLHIGATVTHGDVIEHAAVQQHYGALARAAHWVGSPQARHRGTVVGNLCNASPAADTAPALLAYGALVTIAGPDGSRDIPLETFFQGPGRTALGPAEIVTAVRLPPAQGQSGWGYGRRTRTVIDIALVSACAVIQASNGVCSTVRLGLGAVGPTPLRALRAEALLQGQRPSAAQVAAASRVAAEEARPISDVRCSAEYRKDMVEVLSRRCLESALSMLQMA